MSRTKSYSIGAVTLACALGIGYIMQYGLPGQSQPSEATLDVTGITRTSSAVIAPRLPGDRAVDVSMNGAPIQLAAAEGPMQMLAVEGAEFGVGLPDETADTGFACDIAMTAEPMAGAMVSLALTAPCNASERVTIHHQGLMFTEIMQPDGTLRVTVPVLTERATFMASFASGDGAAAVTEVTSLPFYDRVVVQWKGEAGLQLHAREYGADYFEAGHVWSVNAGNLTAAAKGEGGFLMRLGRMDTPEGLVAEVYSFPSGTALRGGDVVLTVEAEVTARNCNRQVEAQTLEIRDGTGLRVRDLMLEMPDCKAEGDFLVLKNLVEDLKIAAR